MNKQNTLPLTVYKWHGFFLKLGPKLGSLPIRFMAYYALYKIVTNGGVEALAFVCYEHMFRLGETERKKVKPNGAQTRVSPK